MTNDAKLGLVVGMGLVIVVAVVFFRKDLVPTRPDADESVTITTKAPTPEKTRELYRPVTAKTATRDLHSPTVRSARDESPR